MVFATGPVLLFFQMTPHTVLSLIQWAGVREGKEKLHSLTNVEELFSQEALFLEAAGYTEKALGGSNP